MRQARILLVEDETDILLINKAHLEEEGYAVDCAQSLAQARTQLENHPPDLVLLDVLLPDGSGYQLCQEIRQTTTVPIIYLTCCAEDEDVIKGLLLGGDDHITKPYDLQVLSARVAAHLRRAGLLSTGRVELPPLTVDLMTGQVILAGQNIPLSQKEIQLLAFFASSVGRPFTSRELYEKVWGSPVAEGIGTVRVHISNLRKKLQMESAACPFEIRVTKDHHYIFNKIRY